MKRVLGWLVVGFALALLGIGGLVGAAIHDQVRRDDACSANVRQHVAEIERFRTCDNGARQGQAWLVGPLLPVCAGLLWWGRYLLRTSRG